MYNTKFGILMNAYVGVILLFFAGVNTNPLKAFTNPLNNKAVDLFVVVDEGNLYVNVMQLGLIKTALNNLAIELNPIGSSPNFGMFFYGATTSVNIAVPSRTTSASAVKAKLDQKQYSVTQSNPSTLVSALNTVSSQCYVYCRSGVARVTVVFSSTPDSLAEATIRQLERDGGMTVVVVGIGFSANTAVLNRLASHPTRFYAVPVMSFYELILATSHIASVISDVPRLLDNSNMLSISSVTNGIYYTVQLATHLYTTTNTTIVMFASNCLSCAVFGSLSEPNPISANTVANTIRHNFYAAPGYLNSLYYFAIPKNTSRFYVSMLGNGMGSANILCNVFSLPNMMEISPKNLPSVDFLETIG
jgi:hypothetical protein